MKGSETIGIAAALAAAILWGFLGVFIRDLSAAGFSTLQITFFRCITVAVIMGGFIFLRHRRMFAIERRDLLMFVIMAVFGTVLNTVLYFESMLRISLSLSTVLQYISPFIVVVASVPLFKERLTVHKVIALVVAFGGCILCTGVLTDPGSMNILGIALAAASGLFYSMYTLGSKVVTSRGIHVPTILFYTWLISAFVVAPFADLPDAFANLFSSTHNLLMMLGLGVLLTLAPFGLYNIGLSMMEAGKAAIITFVEPLAATVIGLMMFGEAVTMETVVGMALIMVSLIVLERKVHLPAAEEMRSE